MTGQGIANLDPKWVISTLEEIKQKYCHYEPIHGCWVLQASMVASDGPNALLTRKYEHGNWEIGVDGQTANPEYKLEEVCRLVVVKNGRVQELLREGYKAVPRCHAQDCISEDCVVPENESKHTGLISRLGCIDTWMFALRDVNGEIVEGTKFTSGCDHPDHRCPHTPACKPRIHFICESEVERVTDPEEIAWAEAMLKK